MRNQFEDPDFEDIKAGRLNPQDILAGQKQANAQAAMDTAPRAPESTPAPAPRSALDEVRASGPRADDTPESFWKATNEGVERGILPTARARTDAEEVRQQQQTAQGTRQLQSELDDQAREQAKEEGRRRKAEEASVKAEEAARAKARRGQISDFRAAGGVTEHDTAGNVVPKLQPDPQPLQGPTATGEPLTSPDVPVFKEGPLDEPPQQVDGKWVVARRNKYGGRELLPVEQATGFHEDATTGEQTFTLKGQKIPLGRNENTAERQKLLASQRELTADKQAEMLDLADARLRHTAAGEALKPFSKQVKTATDTLANLERSLATAKGEGRKVLEGRIAETRKVLADPNYLAAKAAYDAVDGEVQTHQKSILEKREKALSITRDLDALKAARMLPAGRAAVAGAEGKEPITTNAAGVRSIQPDYVEEQIARSRIKAGGAGDTEVGPSELREMTNMAAARKTYEQLKAQGVQAVGDRPIDDVITQSARAEERLKTLGVIGEKIGADETSFAKFDALPADERGRFIGALPAEKRGAFVQGLDTYRALAVLKSGGPNNQDLTFSVLNPDQRELVRRAVGGEGLKTILQLGQARADWNAQLIRGKQSAAEYEAKGLGDKLWSNLAAFAGSTSQAAIGTLATAPARIYGLIFQEGEMKDRPAISWADNVDALFNERYKAGREGSIADGLGQIIGSTLGFMIPSGALGAGVRVAGVGAKAANTTALAATALMGAVINGGGSIAESTNLGLSAKETWTRFLIAAPLGLSEAAGVPRHFQDMLSGLIKVDRATGGGLKRTLAAMGREALASGGEEAVQEAGQQFLADLGDKAFGIKTQTDVRTGERRTKDFSEILGDTVVASAQGAIGGIIFGAAFGAHASVADRRAIRELQTTMESTGGYGVVHDYLGKLRGQLNTARSEGDAVGVAALKDQIEQTQSALAEAARKVTGLTPDQRNKAAALIGSEVDGAGLARQLEENDALRFASAEIGAAVREQYLPGGRGAAAVAILGQGAGAQAGLDQMIGAHAVNADLVGVLNGGKIEQAKAEAFDRLGLIELDPTDAGGVTYRVTDDALPLLPAALREAVANDADGKYNFKVTDGAPGAVANNLVKSGEDRLRRAADAVEAQAEASREGAKIAKEKGQRGLPQFKVPLTVEMPGVGTRVTPVIIRAANEAEAVKRAVEQAKTSAPKGSTVRVVGQPVAVAETAANESNQAVSETNVPESGTNQTPDATNRLGRARRQVARLFHESRAELVRLGIGKRVEKESLGGPMAVTKDTLFFNPDQIAALAEMRRDASMTEEAAIAAVIDEERWHAIGMQVIKEDEAAEIFRTAPQGMQRAAKRAYNGWEQLTDSQRGHELLRMVLQGRWMGRITEQIYKAIDRIAGYLRGRAEQLPESSALAQAVLRVEARLAELQAEEKIVPELTETGDGREVVGDETDGVSKVGAANAPGEGTARAAEGPAAPTDGENEAVSVGDGAGDERVDGSGTAAGKAAAAAEAAAGLVKAEGGTGKEEEASDGEVSDPAEAERLRRQFEADQKAEQETLLAEEMEATGHVPLLEAVIRLGGLPSKGHKLRGDYGEELNRVWDAVKERNKGATRLSKQGGIMVGKLFTKAAKSADVLARRLGFESFNDLFSALEREIVTGKPHWVQMENDGTEGDRGSDRDRGSLQAARVDDGQRLFLDEEALTSAPARIQNLGKIWSKLTAKLGRGETLNEGEQRVYLEAEKALGQKYLVDLDAVQAETNPEGLATRLAGKAAKWIADPEAEMSEAERTALTGLEKQLTGSGLMLGDIEAIEHGELLPGEVPGRVEQRKRQREQAAVLQVGLKRRMVAREIESNVDLFSGGAEDADGNPMLFAGRIDPTQPSFDFGVTPQPGELALDSKPVETTVQTPEQPRFSDQLFDLPPAAPATPAPVTDKPASPKASEPKQGAVADFGEKIGGARKDNARPLGAREAKPKASAQDESPAWRRRYAVEPEMKRDYMDRVNGLPGTATGRFVVTKDGKPLRQAFVSVAEAELAIPLLEVTRNHHVGGTRVPAGEPRQFGIYRKVGDHKNPLVKGGFASYEDAQRYLAKYPKQIIEHKFPFPERPWLDRIVRTGPEQRTGNVTPAMFQEAFGFRGGEFGNWNMGGDGQAALNHAYEALHDLADAIGVPSRALSLNGELAIAFGARGTGGKDAASAHYEPGYRVINLTKIRGAGALAHEWFHAVDHYLGRQDGKAKDRVDTAKEAGRDVELIRGEYVSHGFSRQSAVREAVRLAFKGVMDTITARAQTSEVATESIERTLNEQNKRMRQTLDELNRQFANHHTYLNKAQATAEQRQQWEALTTRLLNGDVGEKMVIEGKGRRIAYWDSFPVIEELNALYKAVLGRSFMRADPGSDGRMLVWAVKTMQDTRARLAQAQTSGLSVTKKVPTDYHREALAIDQNRASDYWSTPHELGARAFEAYVHDKLAATDRTSQYLANGVENKFYAAFGLKPYPEGAERTAINAAWDRLFEAVEATDTERGTALNAARVDTGTLGFYSVLERTIAAKIPSRASGAQILATLKGAGVKAEEMEFTGLPEWLGTHAGPVAKADLEAFVKAGGVQMQEVTKQDVSVSERPDGQWEVRTARTVNIFPTREAAEEETAFHEGRPDSTKFSKWVLPGGENYKEVLLTLPRKAPPTATGPRGWAELGNPNSAAGDKEFRSSHWDEPNVLAHIRQADHTDTDGNKVRLIEEIQSDWHQQGRKEGYRSEGRKPKFKVEQKTSNRFEAFDADGVMVGYGASEEQARSRAEEYFDGGATPGESGVPDGPFKKTWAELAFKRALRMAVEDGADKIAWTPGEKQAARYNLRKSVDSISYSKSGERYSFEAIKGGETLAEKNDLTPAQLEDNVGKEIAQKMINGEGREHPDYDDQRVLSGLDHKVGGEGMKGFYDKILPDFVRKYVKKWGGTVGTTELPAAFQEREDGGNGWQYNTVHSVTITPAMRDAVVEGQALFAARVDPNQRAFDFGVNSQPGELALASVDAAARVTERAPTEGQKEAGNYKKGHVRVSGLDISIENAAGSTRSGTDGNGKAWSVKLGSHYGYIRGTEGRDGDHVDVMIAPGMPTDWKGTVFVINQVKQGNGHFDEHKAVLGAETEEQARALYLSNYSEGWKGLGSVVPMGFDEFKAWAADPARTAKPAGEVVHEKHERDEKKQAGPAPSIAELVKDNMGLAVTIANGYRNIPGTDFEDILAEARRALVKAARGFDPQGAPFGSYAGTAIRNRLNDVFNKEVRRAKSEVASADVATGESEDGPTAKDSLEDSGAQAAVSAGIEEEETRAALAEALARLPERVRTVLTMHGEGAGLREIGEAIGLSHEMARKILENGKKAVAAWLGEKGFKGVDADGILYAARVGGENDGKLKMEEGKGAASERQRVSIEEAQAFVDGFEENDPDTWPDDLQLVDGDWVVKPDKEDIDTWRWALNAPQNEDLFDAEREEPETPEDLPGLLATNQRLFNLAQRAFAERQGLAVGRVRDLEAQLTERGFGRGPDGKWMAPTLLYAAGVSEAQIREEADRIEQPDPEEPAKPQEFLKELVSRWGAGRLDNLDYLVKGAKDLLLDAHIKNARITAALRIFRERMVANVTQSFGSPSWWRNPAQKKRLDRFTAEILPTAARLNAVGRDTGGGFQWESFWMRAGEMGVKLVNGRPAPQQMMGTNGVMVTLRPGVYVQGRHGEKLKVGKLVDTFSAGRRRAFWQLERFIDAKEQARLHAGFHAKFPEVAHWLDSWIDPALRESRVNVGGIELPDFNRFSLHDFWGEISPFGPVGEVKGYTPDIFMTKSLVGMLAGRVRDLLNRTWTGPGREYKSGEARERGQVRDLFEGFNARAAEAHMEVERRKLAEGLLKKSLKAIPDTGVPAGYVRWDEETVDQLLRSYHAVQGLDPDQYKTLKAKVLRQARTRQAVDPAQPEFRTFLGALQEDYPAVTAGQAIAFLTRDPNGVAAEIMANDQTVMPEWGPRALNLWEQGDSRFSPEEVARIEKLAGKVAVEAAEHRDKMISRAALAELRRPLASQYLNSGLLRILDAGIRGATTGYLANLFTLSTNQISNELMVTMHTARKALEGIMSLPFDQQQGKLALYEAGNLLKGTITDRWYNQRVRELVPDELFDGNHRLNAITTEEFEKSPVELLRELNVSGAILKGMRYGNVDTRAKQRIAFASYVAHGRLAWDEARAAGKVAKGTSKAAWIKDWVENLADESVHRSAYNAAVLVALDYANVPAMLDEGNQVLMGGRDITAEVNLLRRGVSPFSKFPYNLARQGKRYTFDALRDLLPGHVKLSGVELTRGRETTPAEKRQAAASLVMMTMMFLLARGLMDDDDDGVPKLGRELDDLGKKMDGAYQTAGRINVTGTPIGRTITAALDMFGLHDLAEQEKWVRIRALPYAASTVALASVMNRIKGGQTAEAEANVHAVFSDLVSEGILLKLVNAVRDQSGPYDEGKNLSFIAGENLFDMATGRFVPPPVLRTINAMVDPVPRRSRPVKSLDYDPGAIEAVQMRIPGAGQNLPPSGRVVVGADGTAKSEAAVAELLARELPEGSFRRYVDAKGKAKVAYVMPGKVQVRPRVLELFRAAGLNVKFVDREEYARELSGE